jgi:hypothetical protein
MSKRVNSIDAGNLDRGWIEEALRASGFPAA